jgi:hypothetical protein
MSSPRRARLQSSLAALGATCLWLWLRSPVSATVALVAGSLALLAWVSPPLYAPVQRLLDGFVHLLLTAITWLLLGLIYLTVFVPLRLGRALSGHDPLRLRSDPSAASYLQPLPPAHPDRFNRQF